MDTQLLRGVGCLEGISLLLLLFVAMPLKYVWGYSAWVPYVGMAHGVLFLAFLVVLLITSHKMQWSIGMFLLGLLASLLPFGTFLFDAKVKKQAML